MKQIIRRVINKFGYNIVRLTPGKDPLSDISRLLRQNSPIIFDVGANTGQSILKFREKFPRGTIYSFEPSPTTFEILRQQASKFENVHLLNCALGSSSGQMKFLENSESDMSSFLPLGDFGWGEITKETMVEVRTIDQFCQDEGIEHIDILKSDTQGFDFEVFKGAENTIKDNKIGLIYFELIFSDQYKGLPSVAEVFEFLTSRDFVLVTFYDFHYQKQLVSWTDALFAHKSYIQLDN